MKKSFIVLAVALLAFAPGLALADPPGGCLNHCNDGASTSQVFDPVNVLGQEQSQVLDAALSNMQTQSQAQSQSQSQEQYALAINANYIKQQTAVGVVATGGTAIATGGTVKYSGNAFSASGVYDSGNSSNVNVNEIKNILVNGSNNNVH